MGEVFVPVGDKEIRAALHDLISSRFPTLRIVDEVATGVSRMDVTAIGDGLHGFEIKSWRDSLKRLEQQVYDYSQVCTKATLVATVKHLDAAEKLVPEWWGLGLASQRDDGSVKLISMREPQPNPAVDIRRLAQLLWRPELLDSLDRRGMLRGNRSKSRHDLIGVLHGRVPHTELQTEILRTLHTRDNWRTSPSISPPPSPGA